MRPLGIHPWARAPAAPERMGPMRRQADGEQVAEHRSQKRHCGLAWTLQSAFGDLHRRNDRLNGFRRLLQKPLQIVRSDEHVEDARLKGGERFDFHSCKVGDVRLKRSFEILWSCLVLAHDEESGAIVARPGTLRRDSKRVRNSAGADPYRVDWLTIEKKSDNFRGRFVPFLHVDDCTQSGAISAGHGAPAGLLRSFAAIRRYSRAALNCAGRIYPGARPSLYLRWLIGTTSRHE